jgi:hypothetical protein
MSRFSKFLWAAPLFGVILAFAAGIAAPLTTAISLGSADAVRLTGFAVLSAVAAGWFKHRSMAHLRYSTSRPARNTPPIP